MLRARAMLEMRRNCMGPFYDVSRGVWGWRGLAPEGTGLRDFHSDFTLGI